MNHLRALAIVTGVLLCAAVATPLAGQAGSAVNVQFIDYDVVAANGHPHDPAAGPDGTLWYTGQMSHKIGHVDAAGKVKEFDLPGAHGPHGIVADHDGNIWYTGNAAGLIGKLDPKTGKVTEYKMPDPSARDPHTPIFDRQGILWFTVQGANFVGKLDPKSGQVTLKPASRCSRPYGIVMLSSGTPLGAALDTLASSGHITEEEGAQVMVWFRDWVRHGFFARIETG